MPTYKKIFENNREWVKRRKEGDPHFFEKLAEENPGKVSLIAINVDGDKMDTKAIVAKRELHLPVIKDQMKITAERYQLMGTPTSFVISPEGNIQAKYEGAIPEDDLTKLFKG